MDTNDVRVSVALITRNRPETLKRCLESWQHQTIHPYEIIVSDDSDEPYALRVKELAERFGCRYVRGPRSGMYANRNCAALAARGTHILTDDDDHSHPTDYMQTIMEQALSDPRRVWIFPEKDDLNHPEKPLVCPTEMHRSGLGMTPRDPSHCAAIADGSSLYPRGIFDSGLRYDESYPFGGIWYLWGKVLVKAGWIISYCDKTFVWHYNVQGDRFDDPKSLAVLLECTTYVLFVNAFCINPSLANIFWAVAYTLRRMLLPSSMLGYRIQMRLSPASAARALKLALNYNQRNVFV